ncbi:MAG TPA: hypothetical protein P5252_08160 [Candidatus Cloacimonas sp.]|nr:hypothetical protein [Candidatus Cloacimonas sp.]
MKKISFFILFLITAMMAILVLSSCVSQVYPNMLGKWEVFIYQENQVGVLIDFYITTQSGGSFNGEVVVPDGVLGTLSGIVQPDGNVLILVDVTVEHITDNSMSFYGAISSNNRMNGSYTMFEKGHAKFTGSWTANR